MFAAVAEPSGVGGGDGAVAEKGGGGHCGAAWACTDFSLYQCMREKCVSQPWPQPFSADATHQV